MAMLDRPRLPVEVEDSVCSTAVLEDWKSSFGQIGDEVAVLVPVAVTHRITRLTCSIDREGELACDHRVADRDVLLDVVGDGADDPRVAHSSPKS